MASDKKFIEYLKKEISSGKLPNQYLGVAYRYLGEHDKAKLYFKYTTVQNIHASIFEKLSEEYKRDTRRTIGHGEAQLVSGIFFNLANINSDKAKQCFEWAAENCQITDDFFETAVKNEYFDEIAVGYLWRSYALLMLGKYEEAYKLLRQVPEYFNKYKLSGSEVWQVFEPNLPKALIPLCEFKLNSTVENRETAQKGLEDYIKSFREPKFKLEGYLYYYHLKEMFPEVYSEKHIDEKPVENVAKPMPKLASESGVEPEFVDVGGTVFVADSDRCHLWAFGSVDDLLRYVEVAKCLGGYPLLSNLMDVYEVEVNAGLEAGSLIEECERLLATSDDSWLRELTESILTVAEDALREDLGVIFYLDPDVV